MGTFGMLNMRLGGGTLYIGTPFPTVKPASSTPDTTGVSAGGAALTSVVGLTSSCRDLVASSMRSGRSGMMGERGVGEMGRTSPAS